MVNTSNSYDASSTDMIAPQSRLRLTLRGRVVIASMVTLILLGLWLGMAVFGASKADAFDSFSATSESTSFATVVAAPGDTMWSVAVSVAPNADPRNVINDIVRLNQLPSADLSVGQELAIPLRYTN
ncbi:MAG TPA: LysM peptidoglycan-binding domain-containing protein [Microbacteriaceae bacterium]|nr:LysM peptidoglycan-binding domain-containing protein [Microbacteriaceae bacterium]